jgi:PilZ domain
MFKKSGHNKPDPLADRMRKVTGGPPPEEIAYTSIKQTNKRPDREPTFKQGTIMTRGGERIPVVVKNVSSTGARIEFFRDVRLGDHVLVIEPTLQIRTWAEVIWQDNGAAGVKFVRT